MKKIAVFSTLWLSITVAIQRIKRGARSTITNNTETLG